MRARVLITVKISCGKALTHRDTFLALLSFMYRG